MARIASTMSRKRGLGGTQGTLIMPLHLRAKPENKASSGKLRQASANVGQHHGTAQEGKERAGFLGSTSPQTALLRLACRVRYVSQADTMRPEPCVKLQYSVLPSGPLHSIRLIVPYSPPPYQQNGAAACPESLPP
jgi:hypothetical protein